MAWYRTQREVCEYFGKNPDDRKFVGRKIAKGEIRKVDWGYEIVWDSVAKSVAHDTVECGNNTTLVELQGKNTLLEEENKGLKQQNSELSKKVEELTSRVHELEEVCKDSLFWDKNTVKDDPVENKDEGMYEAAYNELYEEHERLKDTVVKIYTVYCHKYIQWKDFKDKYRIDIYVEWEDE